MGSNVKILRISRQFRNFFWPIINFLWIIKFARNEIVFDLRAKLLIFKDDTKI